MSPSDHATAQSLFEEGREHFRLQRPIAAWASWRRALGFVPNFSPALQALESLEQADQLPVTARTPLRFAPPASPMRRRHWDKAFKRLDLEDLSDATQAFAALASDDPNDDDACYNHAVCLAWLGRNPEAIAALRHVVALRAEHRFEQAVSAWVLAEVLRQGVGAETLADDLAYAWTLRCDDAAIEAWLVATPGLRSVAAAPGSREGPMAYTWLDRDVPAARDDLRIEDIPRVLAQVLRFPGTLRVSSPDPIMLDRVYAQILAAFGQRIEPVGREAVPLPLPLMDAAVWNFRLPAEIAPETERRLRREVVEHYYEDAWIHEARHGLDGLTPLAVSQSAREGNATARAQLSAVVRFREQLGARPWTANLYQGYPFDRLRRRLSLKLVDPETVDPADFSCMSELELSGLSAAGLDDGRLTEAYESAAGLRIDRLSARFAAELARRGEPSLGRLDTPALIAPLVREAMNAHEADAALEWLDQARELNAGRDRRTFDVWSAEILARTGDPEGAVEQYEQVLAQDPGNAALALDAAETLLDNGYPAHALPLLDRALERARRSGDRSLAERAERLRQAIGRE